MMPHIHIPYTSKYILKYMVSRGRQIFDFFSDPRWTPLDLTHIPWGLFWAKENIFTFNTDEAQWHFSFSTKISYINQDFFGWSIFLVLPPRLYGQLIFQS